MKIKTVLGIFLQVLAATIGFVVCLALPNMV